MSIKNNQYPGSIDKNAEYETLNETELKLRPKHPESFEIYKNESKFLTQVYLSHPDEPYNLRVRETLAQDGTAKYTATLKDAGTIVDGAKSRLEIETTISPETFSYYAQNTSYTRLQKQRTKLVDGLTIDWFEDGDSLVEIESSAGLLAAYNKGIVIHPDDFENVSADRRYDNESRAHDTYRRMHGHDALAIPAELSIEQAIQDIAERAAPDSTLVVTVAGRSGSGKSTYAERIVSTLAQLHPELSINTLSTDDYHRGKLWLDHHNGGQAWTNWDDPIVYDTQKLAEDLALLNDGQPIPRRRFEYATQETIEVGTILPPNILIIEGIQAHHPNLHAQRDLHYMIETPLATCVGRRMVRDFSTGRINESLGDPSTILRYLLETAEPAYQSQQT